MDQPVRSMSDLQGIANVFDVAATSDASLLKAIVNTPFTILKMETALLFLGIVMVAQVDPATRLLSFVAISDTELAQRVNDVSPIPITDMRIIATDEDNCIIKTVLTGNPQDASDWYDLFRPLLTAEQARMNQASGGIAYSAVYPLVSRSGGALLFSYFQYESDIHASHHAFMDSYTQLVDKALSESAKL